MLLTLHHHRRWPRPSRPAGHGTVYPGEEGRGCPVEHQVRVWCSTKHSWLSEGGGGRMGAVQVKRREHQCQNIKTKPASTAATQLPLDLLEIRRVFRRGNEEKPHSCTARPELRYHELSTEKRFMLVEDFSASPNEGIARKATKQVSF